jgi:squalene synthase HpnD
MARQLRRRAVSEAERLETMVTEKTRAAGTSFYWAMRLLEPKRRLAMYAIYAFCRDVDDIVDEPGTETDKTRRLDLWAEDIALLYQSAAPRQDLAKALAPAIAAYGLPMADFIAVIEGCRMDLGSGLVRPSMAVLDLYCDRVAAAVGRLSVRVFGDFTAHSLELADHQGRALQLTNILRDVAVDAAIGRLYLPDELLTRHGITSRDIGEVLKHPALSAVCAELAQTAERHFSLARSALRHGSRRALRPAVLMLEMYWAIFRKCRAQGWHPQMPAISLPKTTKLWCALRYGVFAGV